MVPDGSQVVHMGEWDKSHAVAGNWEGVVSKKRGPKFPLLATVNNLGKS